MSDIVTINLTDTAVLSEDELLDRARQGDKSAFGTLFLRHRDAARRVAGMCTQSAADADDAVAEGFARVFAALPRMGGRQIAFRPYLLTCVRNAATDRIRRERRVDLREEMPERAGHSQADDSALLGLEKNLVGEALQALPARWRTVLWLTEVEGLSPAEVSSRIGIKPNAVAALAYRARKGLREAYLQAHLKTETSAECRTTVNRLGNYVRADLNEKDRLAVQAHLDVCAKCRCRRDELTDVNATLRNALIPLPLILAGVHRKVLNFSHSVMGSSTELVGVVSATVDSPLAHKALAGITMMALALSGAAVPKLVDKASSQAQVALPGQSSPLEMSVRAVKTPLELSMRGVPVTTSSAPAASAAPSTAAATTSGWWVSQAAVGGATRSSLLGGGSPENGGDTSGATRSTLLNPGSGEGSGGLLAGTVVADALGAMNEILPLDEIVPVDLSASAPVVGEVVGRSESPADLHLSITPAGPLATAGAPISVTVKAPALLSGPAGVLRSLIAPLGGLLRDLGN